MRWIAPADPLPTWRRWWASVAPATGQVKPDELVWHRLAGAWLAISSRTGGWAVFEAAERAGFAGITHAERSGRWRPVVEAAWRRGMITIGGQSVYDARQHREAVEATRDYYTLVLLLNQGCNLVCTYCYLGHAAPAPHRAMAADLARKAVLGALEQPWETILADFGEIAVAGAALRELLPWARAAAEARGKTLRASVQTNGTTLDDELADFLARHDVAVGISLDGPRQLHDAARVFRTGAGSYDRAVAAVRRCGERGLPVHLIATISRHNIGHPCDVVAELAAHRPRSTLLKPVLPEGEAGAAWTRHAITESEYAGFMRAAIQRADHDGADMLDQSAGKFLLRLIGDKSGWRDSCTSRACGSGRSLHVVAADGSVHSCPRFVSGDRAQAGAATGDAGHRRLLPITAVGPAMPGPLPDLLPETLRAAPPSCAGCAWLGSCGGGCTLVAQSGSPAVPMPDPHCVAYQAMHEELFATVITSFFAGRHRESTAFKGAAPQVAYARA
ncbi:MAG TPA: radical SAM protein [Streptosporangiaceae bacterium]|nr:radical SAM protein [Streptosporangiaceae bacterium]